MKTSPVGRALIEKYEGFIGRAYDDANDHVVQPGESVRGVLTIGYGHTSSAGGPKVYVGQSVTKEEADQLLSNDLSKVEQNVTNLVKVPLNQNQFDALVSFQFNTGALGKSSALKKLNAGDYKGAAEALTLYNKAGQIGPGPIPGLVRRRADEKALFLKPVTHAPENTSVAVAVGVGGAVAASVDHPHTAIKVIGITVLAALMLWFLVRHFKHISAAEEVKAAPEGELHNVEQTNGR